jgi:hypothetical protein
MSRDEGAAGRLGDLINRIKAAADQCDQNRSEVIAGDLNTIASELSDIWVDTLLTYEAVEPVFSPKTGVGRSGEMGVMDLCYNAFMIGRRGIPSDPEADRCDWFNDTHPLMRAGVERMRKEAGRRMEYARADRVRQNQIYHEMSEDN